MVAAREQIFVKVDARLSGIHGVAEYERQPSSDPDKFNAVHCYDGGERLIETEAGATRKALSFTVEGYVNGASGPEAHAALNELHANVVKSLLTEPPLDGLVELIEEDGDLRIDVAELASQRRLGFAQDFRVEFATVRGDPGQFA